MSDSIRCQRCGRLMAKLLKDGTYELAMRGKTIAIMINGTLVCFVCGTRVKVARRDVFKVTVA